MQAAIGIGCYQGAQATVAQVASNVWLCHLCPQVAVAIRQAHPTALIVLRPDDGNDGAQVDTTKSPSSEAQRWLGIIQTKLALAPAHTYDATTGINEAWPGDLAGLQWRAVFELALCNLVQGQLGLKYAWGSIPAGNLDANQVSIFADVFRAAWATNAHLYLPPGVTALAGDTGPWYTYRPAQLWLPQLQALGIPLRLLAGEVGTWTPPNSYPISLDAELAVGQSIVDAYSKIAGLEFVGGCCFGVGTVGANVAWDLSSVITKLGIGATTMALTDQYSAIYQQWVAAGGVENNFKAHLIGIGALPQNLDNLKFLAQQLQSSVSQVENTINKLSPQP